MAAKELFISDLRSRAGFVRDIVDKYWSRVEWNAGFSLYGDCLDILKTQLDTILLVPSLAERGNYRESFILCRTAFEHYLYFKLICEADHFFRIWYVKEPSKRNQAVSSARKQIHNGSGDAVRAEPYDKIDKCHFRVVFRDKAKAQHHYWSAFMGFDPIDCFLPAEHYSNYLDFTSDSDQHKKLANRAREHQAELRNTRKAYLTYDAILDSLRLSSLGNSRELKAIEAHYTYLGLFIHPNRIGYKQFDTKDAESAHLLALLYVNFMAAAFMRSLTKLIALDPYSYVKRHEPKEIDDFYNDLCVRHSYFWFVDNDPCRFDQFDNWRKHGSPTENPRDFPTSQIKYSANPFQRLDQVFTGMVTWRVRGGKKVGRIFYTPPENLLTPQGIRVSSIKPFNAEKA